MFAAFPVPSPRLLVPAFVLASATVASGAAAAGEYPAPALDKPPTYEGVELAGIAGYLSPPIRGGTTPFGLGFGARLGLAYEHLYLGVRGMGYLGGSDVDITDRALMGGGEIGYGFHLASGPSGRLTLRPVFGLGGAVIFHTDPSLLSSGTASGGRNARSVDVVSSASGGSSGGGASDVTTVSSVYLRPAVVLLYSSGSFFAGAETSALLLPGIAYSGESATWLSYGLEGQIGCRF